MTNRIRKVRQEEDISDKKNLDSYKFISDTMLQNTADTSDT